MKSERPTRLHLGCFDCGLDDPRWLNTDVTPHLFVARVPGAAALLHSFERLSSRRLEQHRAGVFRRVHYLDLRSRFPLADASFEYAYCSHVLEHLTREEAFRCAAEVRRVLRPGGVFRASVPDLERALGVFEARNPDPFLQLVYEPGPDGRNGHKWMYTEASLIAMLRAAGFSKAERVAYRVGSCPDIDLLDNRPESLFVEATA